MTPHRMDTSRLLEVGVIQRTHGVSGELQVLWTTSYDLDIGESVFLLLEGLPVPFFIHSLRPKGGQSLVLLDGVSTIEQADRLVGAKVLIPPPDRARRQRPSPQEQGVEGAQGYTLLSHLGTRLGTISRVENYAGNRVFVVQPPAGPEVLVPAAEELILEHSAERQVVVVQLPQGLPGLTD